MLQAGNLLPPPRTIRTEEQFRRAMEELRDVEWLAYDTETTGIRRPRDVALFLALSDGKNRYCIGPEFIMRPEVTELMEDPRKKLIAHVANFDAWMMHNVGTNVQKTPGRVYDTAVMHLLYDDLSPHSLDVVASQIAKIYKYSFTTAFPEVKRGEDVGAVLKRVWETDPERVSHYASLDAYATYRVFVRLRALLQKQKILPGMTLWDYYVKYELPFTDVLLDMEMTGVAVDTEALLKLVPELEDKQHNLRHWFTKEAGTIVRPTGKKITEFFFEKLKLPAIKLSKETQKPSMDKESLKIWAAAGFEHAAKLLEWRQTEDMLSRYVGNLRKLISPKTGRLHTTFNQHVVKTGRLSCVSGATLLHTTRGSFRFDEYVPHLGDRVRTHTGALKPILRKVYKGVNRMFRVCLDNGAALECTADHRVLTASGWTRVGTLVPGDSVRTYDVSVEALYAEPGKRASCPGHLPGGRSANTGGDGKAAFHDVPKCTVCGEHALVRGEGKGRAGFEVFPIQDGCCQPNTGEDGKGTTPYEGETGTVVEITPLGTMGVWTIEVAEDHSYATHGFFSKNSSDPNLQNQPKEFRVIFVASEGKRLLVMDYGQVEWRIAAHLSGDKRMLADIRAGKDAHSSTASIMFNVPYDEITAAKKVPDDALLTDRQKAVLKLRSFAKTLNFGILYGEGPFKLSQQLGISKDEAKDLLSKFRTTYPQLHTYFRNVINEATALGFCRTLLGRPRRLPNLTVASRMLVAADERKAKNSPIQGSASDIIKAAMINLHKNEYFTSRQAILLLQVHDELVIEVDAHLEHDEQFNRTIDWHMRNPLGINTLDVPLTIDKAYADNWRDGK